MISRRQPAFARHAAPRDENRDSLTPLNSVCCKLPRHCDAHKSFSTLCLRAGLARRIRPYAKHQGLGYLSFQLFNGHTTNRGPLSRLNPFVCHSYENCRGGGLFFPFWNRASNKDASSERAQRVEGSLFLLAHHSPLVTRHWSLATFRRVDFPPPTPLTWHPPIPRHSGSHKQFPITVAGARPLRREVA